MVIMNKPYFMFWISFKHSKEGSFELFNFKFIYLFFITSCSRISGDGLTVFTISIGDFPSSNSPSY